MPQTDRTKRPKCRWCGRMIVRTIPHPSGEIYGWKHRHTGKVECTRQPMTASLHGKRVAQPPEGFEQMASLPVTTADLKALNERASVLFGSSDRAIDPIGRIAKWLDEARKMGYGSRDIARMLGEVYVGPAPGRAAGSVEELADLLDEMAKGGDSA